MLPFVQQEDGQTGVGDDEGGLRWRNRFVSHRVGVDHRAGLALPNVVGLVHEHVILTTTVQVGQGMLLSVETNLEKKLFLESLLLVNNPSCRIIFWEVKLGLKYLLFQVTKNSVK